MAICYGKKLYSVHFRWVDSTGSTMFITSLPSVVAKIMFSVLCEQYFKANFVPTRSWPQLTSINVPSQLTSRPIRLYRYQKCAEVSEQTVHGDKIYSLHVSLTPFDNTIILTFFVRAFHHATSRPSYSHTGQHRLQLFPIGILISLSVFSTLSISSAA